MTKERPGYTVLNVQVPTILWERLDAEANETGESMARVLVKMLQKRFKVSNAELPPPRRPGRPKK